MAPQSYADPSFLSHHASRLFKDSQEGFHIEVFPIPSIPLFTNLMSPPIVNRILLQPSSTQQAPDFSSIELANAAII
jgi:hypothetical protein